MATSIRNGASPRSWSVRVEWSTPPPIRVGSTPNLVVENHDTYGIIELSLGQGGYAWEFHPEAGPNLHRLRHRQLPLGATPPWLR